MVTGGFAELWVGLRCSEWDCRVTGYNCGVAGKVKKLWLYSGVTGELQSYGWGRIVIQLVLQSYRQDCSIMDKVA